MITYNQLSIQQKAGIVINYIKMHGRYYPMHIHNALSVIDPHVVFTDGVCHLSVRQETIFLIYKNKQK